MFGVRLGLGLGLGVRPGRGGKVGGGESRGRDMSPRVGGGTALWARSDKKNGEKILFIICYLFNFSFIYYLLSIYFIFLFYFSFYFFVYLLFVFNLFLSI